MLFGYSCADYTSPYRQGYTVPVNTIVEAHVPGQNQGSKEEDRKEKDKEEDRKENDKKEEKEEEKEKQEDEDDNEEDRKEEKKEVLSLSVSAGVFKIVGTEEEGKSRYVRVSLVKPHSLANLKQRIAKLKERPIPIQQFLRYTAVWHNEYYVYIDMEEVGEFKPLIDAIIDNTLQLNELVLRKLTKEIVTTLQAVHETLGPHGRIRPDTVLYSMGKCYLYDVLTEGEELTNLFGESSGQFLAPEVLGEAQVDLPADVWALGATLYYLVVGKHPCESDPLGQHLNQFPFRTESFLDPEWIHVSPSLKALLLKMLCVNPAKRLTLPQLLEDEWFKANDSKLLKDPLKPSEVMKRLRQYDLMALKFAEIFGPTTTRKMFRQAFDALVASAEPMCPFNKLVEALHGDKATLPFSEEHYQTDVNFSSFIVLAKSYRNITRSERLMLLYRKLLKKQNADFQVPGESLVELNSTGLFITTVHKILPLFKSYNSLQPALSEDEIKEYQLPQREDLCLCFENFLSLCQILDLYPSDEVITLILTLRDPIQESRVPIV